MRNFAHSIHKAMVTGTFVLGVVGLGFLALLGAADAVLDWSLNRPINLTQELSEVVLATVFFLVLPMTERQRQHVSVDVVVGFFPKRIRGLCVRLGALVSTLVLGIIAYRLWFYALASLEIREAATASVRFPIYPFKCVCALAATAAALEALRQLLFVPDLGVEPTTHEYSGV